MNLNWMGTAEGWVAFLTLAALEIVLGIDNVIFISILVGRLPEHARNRVRSLGLLLAMLTRVLLLLALSWMMSLGGTLFELAGRDVSGRDLILGAGGLFLLWKATGEIHHMVEPAAADGSGVKEGRTAGVAAVLLQIALLDIVFSVDSVITAVGMVDQLSIMILAIVVAVGVMLVASRPLSEFIERHPTLKTLALAFLIMVGMVLIAEAFEFHVPKGYVYTAMVFSLVVELLNIRVRAQRRRV